jgi:hypothetical protein
MTPAQDPFYIVKEEIQESVCLSLCSFNHLLDKFLRNLYSLNPILIGTTESCIFQY